MNGHYYDMVHVVEPYEARPDDWTTPKVKGPAHFAEQKVVGGGFACRGSDETQINHGHREIVTVLNKLRRVTIHFAIYAPEHSVPPDNFADTSSQRAHI